MTEQFTKGYALLVGVHENQWARLALPIVKKDVDALAAVLKHPQRCGYAAAQVKTLTGPDATRQGILDGLDWLQEQLAADTSGNATALVYYSGHGWRTEQAESPEYYFLPYDVQEHKVKSRALRAPDFAEAVEALQPRRLLVILDCCHAGGMGVKELPVMPPGYVAAAAAPALLMPDAAQVISPGAKDFAALAQGQGRAVLSSSTGAQSSYLRRDKRMSIFTYHLIEALTGHAQPAGGAAEVLVSDVVSHVHRQVPHSAQADWERDQTPDFRLSGNFPVALLFGGKGLAAGQAAPDPLADPVVSLPQEPGKVVIGTVGDYANIVTGEMHVETDQRGQQVGQQFVIQGDWRGALPPLPAREPRPPAAAAPAGSPRADLEQNMRQAYRFMQEYAAARLDSDRPEEQARAARQIAKQKEYIRAQLAEYLSCYEADMPEDIRQLAEYVR